MDKNFKIVRDPRSGEVKHYTVSHSGGEYGNSLRINLPPTCGLTPGDTVEIYTHPDGSLLIMPIKKGGMKK